MVAANPSGSRPTVLGIGGHAWLTSRHWIIALRCRSSKGSSRSLGLHELRLQEGTRRYRSAQTWHCQQSSLATRKGGTGVPFSTSHEDAHEADKMTVEWKAEARLGSRLMRNAGQEALDRSLTTHYIQVHALSVSMLLCKRRISCSIMHINSVLVISGVLQCR